MSELLRRLWHEEKGQDLVEYGLLVVLVALGAVAGMSFLATGACGMRRKVRTWSNTACW